MYLRYAPYPIQFTSQHTSQPAHPLQTLALHAKTGPLRNVFGQVATMQRLLLAFRSIRIEVPTALTRSNFALPAHACYFPDVGQSGAVVPTRRRVFRGVQTSSACGQRGNRRCGIWSLTRLDVRARVEAFPAGQPDGAS